MAGLKVDPYSETWRAVREHVDTEIELARGKLESRNLPAIETEYHRGRIAALRQLQRLQDDGSEDPEVTIRGSYVD